MLPHIPSPKELQESFYIPRTQIKYMATWLELSESMVFQMLRQGRKPSAATAERLSDVYGISQDIWTESVDTIAKTVYTIWYTQLTAFQKPSINELF